jgi:hypothetical protein
MCLLGTRVVPHFPNNPTMIKTKSKHVQARKLPMVISYHLLLWKGLDTTPYIFHTLV